MFFHFLDEAGRRFQAPVRGAIGVHVVRPARVGLPHRPGAGHGDAAGAGAVDIVAARGGDVAVGLAAGVGAVGRQLAAREAGRQGGRCHLAGHAGAGGQALGQDVDVAVAVLPAAGEQRRQREGEQELDQNGFTTTRISTASSSSTGNSLKKRNQTWLRRLRCRTKSCSSR